MQNALGPADSSSASNPILDVWVQYPVIVDDGTGATISVLGAPVAMSWAIQAITSDDQLGAPVTVASGTSNLTADKVPGAEGHYAATTSVSAWSPAPAAQGFGRYQITWTISLPPPWPPPWYTGPTPPDPPPPKVVTMTRDFDVLKQGVPQPWVHGAYATVSDLRDEGVAVPDMRLLRLIHMASRYAEDATGRFFEPRWQEQRLSGTGGRSQQFGDPLIAVHHVSFGNPVQNTVGLGSLRLYNRHLTARLTNPDDRDDPKIEFVHFKEIFGRQRSSSIDSPLFGVPFRDLFFPGGVQNVNVLGLWGYTDWDGSPAGRCPELLRHAVKLLVMREIHRFTDDDRDDRKRYRLTTERTRDQSYVLDKLEEGPFTGDREVDDLLLRFRRPLLIASP